MTSERESKRGPSGQSSGERRLRAAASALRGVAGADAGAAENTHDKLGRAISELLENPLVTGTVGRALGAREKAAQAQELAMGALNLPSAADIERLTRRLRSVSQRLEGVEDGVERLGRALMQSAGIDARLAAIDGRLAAIDARFAALERLLESGTREPGAAGAAGAARSGAAKGGAGARTKAAGTEAGSRRSRRASS